MWLRKYIKAKDRLSISINKIIEQINLGKKYFMVFFLLFVGGWAGSDVGMEKKP